MQTESLSREGVLGPISLVDSEDCREILSSLSTANTDYSMDWPKALAVHNPHIYALARHPELLKLLRMAMGDDILLWGAAHITRSAGQTHPWHNDIECLATKGKAISVWVGLENTSIETGLSFISRSHTFGQTIQEVRSKKAFSRGGASNEDILSWAHEFDDEAALLTPQISDGQAVIFEGNIWHSSHNTSQHTRRALLLQYCTPDMPVYMPDLNFTGWPAHKLTSPRPACIPISGRSNIETNRIVSGPLTFGGMRIELSESRIHPLHIPLPIPDDKPWMPHHQFKGATSQLQWLTCHVSALKQGMTPHPPHHHREEELLMVLDGEVEIHLPDLGDGASCRIRLSRGDIVYYPAWFYHTLTTVSEKPANYLMFKWYNNPVNAQTADMAYWKINALSDASDSGAEFATTLHHEEKTDCLYRLHVHTSIVQPGGGYAPHADAYDVAIVTLEGVVTTLDTEVHPNSVIYYPAGSAHGLTNSGDDVAKYVVFEFHGVPSHSLDVKRPLWTKIRDPKAWTRKVRSLLKG